MNFKRNNGITLIALVITVIVMLILIGTGMHFGKTAIRKAKLEDIKTDMISIKTKAEIIADKYNFKEIDELVGSTITNEEAETLGIENSNKIRKWSENDLNEQGLSTIKGDTYVVSYNLKNVNKCEIYVIAGYDGVYSLTDLQGK